MLVPACDPHTGGMEKTPAPRGVFIVEDSPIVRERLVALMGEIAGISVVGEANTAREAVDGILRTLPTWVLLDIQLIGGSGIEVLRQVRTRVPGTRFVILTHLDNPQYRRTCMQAGADYFFDKTQTVAVREIIARPN
jgi:DNA-binding NarL/FixJ family response regulator